MCENQGEESAWEECSAKRTEKVHVSQHCPTRPYIELLVPMNARSVRCLSFLTVSHDQGWCSQSEELPTYEQSYTWFQASVRRPDGREDLPTMVVQRNRRAKRDFYTHRNSWDHQDSDQAKARWVQSLRAGDYVQLICRAYYQGWVNIVQEAEIRISYEPWPSTRLASTSGLIPPSAGTSELYRPLGTKSNEIRLLVLHSGSFNDPILCSLTHSRLTDSEPRKFEALSYCWGDPSDRTSISMEELQPTLEGVQQMAYKDFSVTCSVETALRRLRYADGRSRHLWIDAVCINQDDTTERAQQVSIMAEIYSRAESVHIWLGEGHPNAELALRVIRDISNFNCHICPGGEECHCPGTSHWLSLGKEQSLIDEGPYIRLGHIFDKHFDENNGVAREDFLKRAEHSNLIFTMAALFQNPWFQRVWVFQEAIRARAAIVHCGSESITWDELIEVNSYLDSPDNTFQAPHMEPQILMPSLWTKLIKPKAAASRTNSRFLLNPGILDVFLEGLELKASDPRDKLFALFSFGRETSTADTLPLALHPNYTKSVNQVFADFTRWWILEHRSLGILSCIHSQPGRTWQNLNCPMTEPPHISRPTWAIGSDGKFEWARATLSSQIGCRASADVELDEEVLKQEADPHLLSLSGFEVAEIKQISHFPMDLAYRDMPDLLDAFDKIFDPSGARAWWTGLRKRDKALDLREKDDALQWRMKVSEHQTAHWRYGPEPPLAVMDIAGGVDNDGRYGQRFTKSVPPCMERCFFVTADGLCGLCPSTARERDRVVVFLGGSVPFLLRKAGPEAEASHTAGRFELVGECFVRSVMNGEFVEEQRKNGVMPQVFSLV